MPYPRDSKGNIIPVDGIYSIIYFIIGILAPAVLPGLALVWIGKRLDTLFWKMLKV